MKKLLFMALILIMSCSLFANVIKNIPEDLLNACLSNMQVGDPGFSGDKPTLKLGRDPYSWKLSWAKGPNGTGYVNIPVGAFADTKYITFKYRVNSINNCNITIKNIYNKPNDADNPYRLMGSQIPQNVYILTESDKVIGEIKESTFENTRHAIGDKGYTEIITVEFAGEGSCEFELFDVTLFNSKGEKYNCFDYDWSMRNFEMPPNYKDGKLFTRDHTVYIGMSTIEATHPDGQARIKRLKELVPNLGCDGGDLATLLALNRDFFAENDIPAYYQFGGSSNIEPVVSENKAHLETPLGVSRDTQPGSGSFHHEYDWSDQSVIDAFSESIKRCGEMGIPEYQFIDAVWQYNGKAGFEIGSLDWRYGNWGFNEKTFANFRLALNEKDKGIKFGKYGTGGKTVHFHEYVKMTTGVTLKPADLGLKSWDEYVPCVNGFSSKEEIDGWKEKTGSEYDHLNFFVSFMLRHYEWLKLFSEVGEAGVKAGCDVVAMPNGSNWANGNDIDGILQLANVKVLIDETRFYRPTLILSGYAELPVWRDMINKYNKHHRLICEVGMGGGANIYFAPLFSYIKNYSLTSTAHYDSMQCDWVWGGVNENSDKLGFEAYEDFLFKAWGFNAATEDKGERNKDCKRAIRLVTPYSVYINSPLSNVVPERFKSTFKYSFYNNTFPYEIMNFSEYRQLDPKCDLMVVDTVNMPQETADKIQDKVLNSKMTLLLGAYSAGCEADGVNYNNCWGKENWAKLDKPLGMNEETRKLIDRDLNLSEHINKYDLFGRVLKGVFCDGIKTITGNVDGINLNYKGEYYFITSDKAKTVLSVNDMPVLSQITFDNGSNVYYYHLNAGVCQELDDYVLSIVYKNANIKPEGKTDNAYLERWTLENGCEAVSLFSKSSFAKYAGPPIRWDYLDIYDKDSKASAVIETKVKGDYVIFDFINNKVIDDQKGQTVTLNMDGTSANLYYIIPVSKADEMIKTLKERRDKLQYWENLRREKFYKS